MLPTTARENDIVEVTHEEHDYYGTLGKIVKLGDVIEVDVYGKIVTIPSSHLTLRARVGSKTHQALSEEIELRRTNSLTVEDYDELINIAIDMQEYGWATELVERKKQLKKSRG